MTRMPPPPHRRHQQWLRTRDVRPVAARPYDVSLAATFCGPHVGGHRDPHANAGVPRAPSRYVERGRSAGSGGRRRDLPHRRARAGMAGLRGGALYEADVTVAELDGQGVGSHALTHRPRAPSLLSSSERPGQASTCTASRAPCSSAAVKRVSLRSLPAPARSPRPPYRRVGSAAPSR